MSHPPKADMLAVTLHPEITKHKKRNIKQNQSVSYCMFHAT